MRPVRLRLEGFTSFTRPVDVDFSELDLFAIVGPTGAGKSSLLDAMLFALYGRTPRINERAAGELVTLGATHMSVSFEFEAGEKRCTVTRTRRLSGRKWVSDVRVDGAESVEGLLGLDFDGFTRAVILPQGQFDEFLRGETSKRSEILKDLLNLRVYEEMMRSANLRASALKGEVERIERELGGYADATPELVEQKKEEIAELERERGEKAGERERLQEWMEQARELRELRKRVDGFKEELRKARAEKEKQSAAGAALERTIRETGERVARLEEQARIAGYDARLWSELTEARLYAKQVAQAQAELGALRGKRKDAVGETDGPEAARVRREVAEAALREAEARHGSASELRRAAAELAGVAVSDVEGKRQAAGSAEEEYEHIRQMHLAVGLRAHLKSGEPCPVCGQVVKKVPAGGVVEAVEQAKTRMDQARAALRESERQFDQWKTLRERCVRMLGEDAEDVDARILTLAGQLERMDEARRSAEQGYAYAVERDSAMRRLKTAAADLRRFPDWEHLPLEEMEAALDEQNRKKADQERLDAELDAARKAQTKALLDSSQAQARLLAVASAIDGHIQNVAEGQARIALEEKELQPKLADFQLAPGMDEAKHIEVKLNLAEKLTLQLVARIATERQGLLQLEQRVARAVVLGEELEGKRRQREVYHEMGQLLKSSNFVAFIQRQALKLLAELASKQLWDLSEQRYRLTLADDDNEFYVSDEWSAGQKRSSKTLSGGESFLASLALALALSDSLTGFGNSQTRLESLFLDEGFSTLDGDSLQTAIDAIVKLASDRRMVGVISHLPELAAQLPARIRVEKSASGSSVFVETEFNHPQSIVAGG